MGVGLSTPLYGGGFMDLTLFFFLLLSLYKSKKGRRFLFYFLLSLISPSIIPFIILKSILTTENERKEEGKEEGKEESQMDKK